MLARSWQMTVRAVPSLLPNFHAGLTPTLLVPSASQNFFVLSPQFPLWKVGGKQVSNDTRCSHLFATLLNCIRACRWHDALENELLTWCIVYRRRTEYLQNNWKICLHLLHQQNINTIDVYIHVCTILYKLNVCKWPSN